MSTKIMINKVQKYIEEEFFSKEKFKLKPFINADKNQEIYHNEANLQYKLALSLKEEFKDKIEIKLEYPVQKLFNDEKIKLSKKEIDIIIKIKNKKEAFLIIELDNFPPVTLSTVESERLLMKKKSKILSKIILF